MQRLLLGLVVVGALAAAVAWSGADKPRPEFEFESEKLNPVTNLKLNNDPSNFQFAIVSDRTGGHRARIFSRAITQLNLMQPEFVVSVGDLIEGYTQDKAVLARQWREFQSFVSKLEMPFFYVPGNHDLANKVEKDLWNEKFGRSYYHFVYRDVLFLMLDSEDPPGVNSGKISADQLNWLKGVLNNNAKARWTLVFLHKPIWVMNEKDVATSGWLDAEKLLKGRSYTVFAGHVHRYQKFVRQGMNYYMLATTGGGSKLRGPAYGEFDHIMWVTMKKEGPVLANILLDGILRENLAPIASDEDGVTRYNLKPTYPVTVKVTRKGKPIPGAYVVFQGSTKETSGFRGDGLVGNDGTLRPSTYTAHDGLPAATYTVTVVLRKPFFSADGKVGPNQLPAKYADPKTSGLTATIKAASTNNVDIDLQD